MFRSDTVVYKSIKKRSESIGRGDFSSGLSGHCEERGAKAFGRLGPIIGLRRSMRRLGRSNSTGSKAEKKKGGWCMRGIRTGWIDPREPGRKALLV